MMRYALLALIAASSTVHAGQRAGLMGYGPTGRLLYGSSAQDQAGANPYASRSTPNSIKMYTRGGVNAGIGESYSAVGGKAATLRPPRDEDAKMTSKAPSRSLSNTSGDVKHK